MSDVWEKTKEAGGDDTFCSHMVGLAEKFQLEWDSTINRNTLPKLAQAYMDYTQRRYAGENLHAGGTIYFSQFVKSALDHWSD